RRGPGVGARGGRARGRRREAVILFGLVVTALVYLHGWQLARAGAPGRIPSWRAGCFYAGLVSIGIASASPLAHCDAGSLTLHMVQHLLLQTIAPPLIFFGEPLRLLGQGLPVPLRRAILDRSLQWP